LVALVISKHDRLPRDAHFMLGLELVLIEFIATGMPEAKGPPPQERRSQPRNSRKSRDLRFW
jgi:hypothetical protein